MRIEFDPVGSRHAPLKLDVTGTTIIADGYALDLSAFSANEHADGSALDSGDRFRGAGRDADGTYWVRVRRPKPSADPPSGWADTITVAADGPITLAGQDAPSGAQTIANTVTVASEDISTPAARLAAARAFMVVERTDFALACLSAGIITATEAQAWASGQSLPTVAETYVGTLPEAQQAPARITMLSRVRIRRTAPEIIAIGAALEKTDVEIDALFGA